MRFDQCGAVAQGCNSDGVQEKKRYSALEHFITLLIFVNVI